MVIASAASVRAHIESSLGGRLASTLLLRERVAPLTVSTGLRQLDALTAGLPRGALSEFVGPCSSGRTGAMMAALAESTRRQEACALVDAGDSFDPASAVRAGVALERLLWVRCSEGEPRQCAPSFHSRTQRRSLNRIEQVLKVTDLLLQSGGFGMVVLDLGDIPSTSARRIPLTSWFRFRRAVEQTATVLLVVEQEPCAKTCASLVVRLQRQAICACNAVAPTNAEAPGWKVVRHGDADVPANNVVSHAALLQGIRLHAEVLRSWSGRKPVQSAGACFELAGQRTMR